ncbi:chitinase [Pseudarthrobacter defluvii]|uniref:chitinase n=1 Tax=Pseudarthrobacter defluvii TaxID=410837 RepID=UPI00278AC203|nr:chitinase [Pseudarthrobacter defluvii]MDQ0769067.1 chitinase [Pseudarthrobacter defluvii]
MTLPPGPALENAAAGRATTLLAFITANPAQQCVPSWGGTISLDEAGRTLQLDDKIRQFRAAGNDVGVSFGGHRGPELATACQDVAALAEAYITVINRYSLDIVDLDVEGQAADPVAAKTRAQALARIQAARPKGSPLRVWLTLPVARDGLDSRGKDNVKAMLSAGVDLAGVNIMTMNFGPLRNRKTMLSASQLAAEAAHQDLEELYSGAGKPADAGKIWQGMGVTPMVGENDVADNTFSLQDASGLNSFARERGVGRMSLWSINRDTGCSKGPEEEQQPSSSCSGIEQDTGDFTRVLSNAFTGSS